MKTQTQIAPAGQGPVTLQLPISVAASSVQQVQVPGSKFHYVRLVSPTTQSTVAGEGQLFGGGDILLYFILAVRFIPAPFTQVLQTPYSWLFLTLFCAILLILFLEGLSAIKVFKKIIVVPK